MAVTKVLICAAGLFLARSEQTNSAELIAIELSGSLGMVTFWRLSSARYAAPLLPCGAGAAPPGKFDGAGVSCGAVAGRLESLDAAPDDGALLDPDDDAGALELAGASLLDGALTVESLLPHAVAIPTVSVNPAAAVTIRTQSPLTATSLAIVVKNRHVPRQDLGHATEDRDVSG